MFYKVASIVSIFLSKILLRVKVHHKEYEPTQGPVILCANHISLLDPILVAAWLKRPAKFMAKEEMFHWPVIGFFAKKVGAFPVSRGPGDLTAIKTALKTLKDGNVLGIFPEGGRKHDEDDSAAKAGIASLAYKTKATIFPAHIITKKAKIGLFTKVDIVYGKPIPFEELGFQTGSSEEIKQISQHILKIIFSLKV